MIPFNNRTMNLIKDYHLIYLDYYQLDSVKVNIESLAHRYHSECDYITLTYDINDSFFHEAIELCLKPQISVFFIVLPTDMNKEDYKDLLKYVYLNKNEIRFVFIPLNHDSSYLKQLKQILSQYLNIQVLDHRKNSLDDIYHQVCTLFKEVYIDIDYYDKAIYKHMNYLLNHTYLNEEEIKIRAFDDLIKEEKTNEDISYYKISFIE